MYAIKKHINKALAVFLCACLLLSYNPAFGAVDAAWAADPADPTDPPFGSLQGQLAPTQSEVDAGVNTTDPNPLTPDGSGNWNASTEVRVTTFNSELKTDASGTVYGKRNQITAENPNPIIVEAACGSGKSAADYEFKWSVTKDGVALDDAAQQRLQDAADASVSGYPVWDDTRKVARSVVDLRPLVANDDQNYVNNAKYVFTIEVSLKADPAKKATETITLYTVDENDKGADYSKVTRLESTDTPYVVATGGFLENAKLVTEMATGTENVQTAFTNKAANMKTDTVSYGTGPIYQVDVKGGLDVEGVQLPPYDNDGYTLWFPIDDAYVYDEAKNNRNGYKEGDEITVWWKGNLASAVDTIQPVAAKVVKDPQNSNKLMAEISYDAVKLEVTGKDGNKYKAAADWMYHPGFFGVLYPSDKAKPGEGEITYYTVNASVKGNVGGTVSANPGQVRTGTEASFDIIPEVTETIRYKVSKLMFTDSRAASSTPINLLANGVSVPGVTIDAAHSHVTVGSPLNDAANYNQTYTFEVEFEQTTTNTDSTNQTTFALNMSVVDESGNPSDRACIEAEYTKKGETALQTVNTANGQNAASADVLYTGQANLTFRAHAPENGKIYGIKKVETSPTGAAGSWQIASLAGGKLNIPYMDSNMYVRVTAGEVENTTLPTYYNVTVKTDGSLGCSVTPAQGIVAVSPTDTSSMSITATGTTAYYPASLTIKEGTAAPRTVLLDNDTAKDTTKTHTYTPPDGLNGDVEITVNFAPRSVTYELKTTVITQNNAGTVVADKAGGTISPTWASAGVSPFTVVGGETYPFLIEADPDYAFVKAELYENGTKKNDLNVVGGALSFVPSANSEIRVTFKEKAEADKPGSNPDKSWAVNAYVADDDLKSNSALSYITDWGETVDGQSMDVAGYSDQRGQITSGMSASVAHGSSFPMTFKPATTKIDNKFSKVEKVLVVTYALGPDGTSKTATSKKMYATSELSFVVSDITAPKDIIVYFAADDTATEPPVDETKDYVNVTVNNDNPTAGTVSPAGTSQVVPGGSLGLEFSANEDYELSGITVSPTPGSTAGSKTYDPTDYLLISNIKTATTVSPAWTKPLDPELESHRVKLPAAGLENGEIRVGEGNKVTTAGYPVTEATAGAGLPAFKLSWIPASGYELESETITWDESDVYAFLSTSGTTPQIRFTKENKAQAGETVYTKGTPLVVSGTTAGSSLADTWQVAAGLPCEIIVGATFIQSSEPPVDPSADYWTVTTKVVGEVAGGTIEPSGQQKVKKDAASANNYKITFNKAAGFKVKNVEVKRQSGNAFVDFWEGLVGFITGTSTAATMEQQAITQGFIEIAKVDANYEVSVEYEAIPEETDPDSPILDMLPVNVIFNSLQGDVQPNQNVVIKKNDGTRQFVVSPGKAQNGLYYGVEKVIVDGVDVPRGTDANGITWDSSYNNVFTLSAAGKTQAITVEVVFTEQGTVAGTDGGTVSPGTPKPEEKRNVTVNVTNDGKAIAGDGGVGGLVAPRGGFSVPKNSQQMVVVAPGSDYLLKGITVSGGVAGETGAAFLAAVEDHGYFDVAAADGKMDDLTITVEFESKPMDDRSYVIHPNVSGGNGSITPSSPIQLANNESYTLFVQPDTIGYCVATIKDQYKDASNKLVDVPGGLSFDRAAATGDEKTKVISLLNVKPIRVNGEVVDRYLTVTFGPTSDYGISDGDHVADPGDLVNLRVSVFGTDEGDIVKTSPNVGNMRVYKGTKDDPASYLYSFWLSEKGIKDGYKIYRVMMNGEDEVGSAEATTGFTQGTFEFTTANMTRSTNVLSVYVKKLDSGSTNPGSSVDIEIGWGDGGTVDVSRSRNLMGVMAQSSNVEADDRLSNMSGDATITVSSDGPFELPPIVPAEGKVIKKVYLYNCTVYDFAWQTPEGGTAATALKYYLQITDPKVQARVFVAFQDGDENTFHGWDWDEIDNTDDYMLNSNLTLHLLADDGSAIEALAGKDSAGKVQADKLVSVSNPDAPMSPNVAAETSGYKLEYNTLKNENVELVVGDLIKLNSSDPKNSTIYTIDKVEFSDGTLVSIEPITTGGRIVSGAGEDSGDNAATAEEKPDYYKQYLVKGKTTTMNASSSDRKATATITLKKLSAADGNFPEFPAINDPSNPTNPDNPGDDKTYYTVSASASPADGGSITPTSTTPASAWNGSNATGPWSVASGTSVSFKVEPADGYVLSALSCGNVDALKNGAYNSNTRTLTFAVRSNVEVKATFAKQGSSDSMRTVKIEVEGSHGTTSPKPDTYSVEKGKSYPITFVPDDGYVPYRIWVDGVQSYVSPTLAGWTLPASWSNQTFKVQYALAGTTPTTGDYLAQTGQNLATQAGAALSKTGDNPWPLIALIVVAGGAAFAVIATRRRKATAARAAKYSVTRRR